MTKNPDITLIYYQSGGFSFPYSFFFRGQGLVFNRTFNLFQSLWLCFGHIWQWERSGKLRGNTLWSHKFEMEVCFCISARSSDSKLVRRSAFSVCSDNTRVGGPEVLPFHPWKDNPYSCRVLCLSWWPRLGGGGVPFSPWMDLINKPARCLFSFSLAPAEIPHRSSLSYFSTPLKSCTFHTWGGMTAFSQP